MSPNGSHPLKALILEDEPSDAELMMRQLRRSGLNFTAKQVETRDAFIDALETLQHAVLLDD